MHLYEENHLEVSHPVDVPADAFRVLLVSLYEMGRQPVGLASPAAWLRDAGFRVDCIDLSRQPLEPDRARHADLIGIHLPMHTATRLAVRLIPRLKEINPRVSICCYGLYAPLNREVLCDLGCDFILGGEYEALLTGLATHLSGPQDKGRWPAVAVSFDRLRFRVPDRRDLPPLSAYARMAMGQNRSLLAGYAEASRGCLHTCRHCPIVPVYGGRFRIVPMDEVLADVFGQIESGARHMTFGDPDFFNGVGHSLAIVERLHNRFPEITYDVTTKVEHLLKYRRHLPALRATGCIQVTTAVESLNDKVLRHLKKGHTRSDFFEVLDLVAEQGMTLNPTFIPFTPWTTREEYRELLRTIADLELVENVSPVQLAIRLLVTAKSPLLELPDIQACIGPYHHERLVYPWTHRDPAMDRLQERVFSVAEQASRRSRQRTRAETFQRIWSTAFGALEAAPKHDRPPSVSKKPVPFLTESWFC